MNGDLVHEYLGMIAVAVAEQVLLH